MATISTHNGSDAHRQHNNRTPSVCSKEPHIDLTREHENWIDLDPRTAYKEIFGQSVEEYNARQKRDDRKIKDYYQKVCDSKKKHAVYEMIAGVYDKQVSDRTKKQILKEFVSGWEQRNPNLALIGAYYHADEEGEPHVHLDYVPVARDQKRGMKTKNALDTALRQEGFISKTTHETAQIMWEQHENKVLEDICQKYGITVQHNLSKQEHIHTELYKAEQGRLQQSEAELEQKLTDYQTKQAEHLPEPPEMPLESLEPVKPEKILFKGEYVPYATYQSLEHKYNRLQKSYETLHGVYVKVRDTFKDITKALQDTILHKEKTNETLKELLDIMKRSTRRSESLVLREENEGLKKQLDEVTKDYQKQLKEADKSYARQLTAVKSDYTTRLKEAHEETKKESTAANYYYQQWMEMQDKYQKQSDEYEYMKDCYEHDDPFMYDQRFRQEEEEEFGMHM